MESARKLNQSQIRKYHEEGFLLVKGLFNQDQVNEFVKGLNDLAARRDQFPASPSPVQRFVLEQLDKEEMAKLPPLAAVRKMNFIQDEPFAQKYTGEDSAPAAICRQLLGKDDLIMIGMFVFAKPARHGTATPWHQDQCLWPRFVPLTPTCWVALDPCTQENGCLQFYRGGHRDGIFRHVLHDGDIHINIPKEDLDPQRIVAVPMEAGDALFFDGMIPHFSESNRSDKRRLGMSAIYGSESDYRFSLDMSKWLETRRQHGLLYTDDEEFLNSRPKMY